MLLQNNASTIEVDGIRNNSNGKVWFYSPDGTITGDATFTFKDAFERVDLINNSNKDLLVNDIDVINKNKTDPDLKVQVTIHDGFHYTIDTGAFADTVVFITNNHILGGDIVLKGLIDNPLGLTTIHSGGGDILRSGATAGVQTRQIDLTADRGSIGASALARIPITLMVNLAGRPTRIIRLWGAMAFIWM